MMHMVFWFGLHLDDLMIKGLNISTVSGLVAICFGFLFLTLVYEGIRVSREHITEKASQKMIVLKRNASAARVPRREEAATERLRYFILQTCLHFVQIVVGYSIMLAVMTYNVYIFMSVIIGAGLGYFCFGLILMSRSLNVSCIPRKHYDEELYSPATHTGSDSCSTQDGAASGKADDSVSDPEQDRPRCCHKKERKILVVNEDDSEVNVDFIEAVKDKAAALEGSSDYSDTHPGDSVCA